MYSYSTDKLNKKFQSRSNSLHSVKREASIKFDDFGKCQTITIVDKFGTVVAVKYPNEKWTNV